MAALPAYRAGAEQVREMLLANLALVAEIPAPTFEERPRAEVVAERFAAAGLQGCVVDGHDNASALRPGTVGEATILLAAHADTLSAEDDNPHIEIHEDRVVGPFVGDNAIAIAALATLPVLLDQLDIRLKSNLVFLAASRSLGRGNLAGLRKFLGESGTGFQSALCVESFQLGRLNYASTGMLRGEIICRLPPDYDWAQFGSTGTIIPMADIINRISRIPIPQRPLTSVVLGAVHGGIAPGNVARETTLAFELRSESASVLNQVREQLEDIVEDAAAQSGKLVSLDIYARREPGSLDIGHPLVRQARAILTGLGLAPAMYATTSMMAALCDAHVPALTIGLTTGERRSELYEIEEAAAIAPLAVGLAQLVGLVQAMDEGLAAP
jgi:acetylornithine deacetylase/succinyl-diaminopimelate desuccinylase-like protein